MLLLLIWGLFEERLPCLEITAVTMIFGAFAFLLGLAIANVCYFLGPLGERILRPSNADMYRRWTFGAGLALSLLLIFAPPVFNLALAFSGLSCVDKFGETHEAR